MKYLLTLLLDLNVYFTHNNSAKFINFMDFDRHVMPNGLIMGISAISGPLNQPFFTHEKPVGHKIIFKIKAT
jgi:hypothetical protein